MLNNNNAPSSATPETLLTLGPILLDELAFEPPEAGAVAAAPVTVGVEPVIAPPPVGSCVTVNVGTDVASTG